MFVVLALGALVRALSGPGLGVPLPARTLEDVDKPRAAGLVHPRRGSYCAYPASTVSEYASVRDADAATIINSLHPAIVPGYLE